MLVARCARGAKTLFDSTPAAAQRRGKRRVGQLGTRCQLHIDGTLGRASAKPRLPEEGDWVETRRRFEARDVKAFCDLTGDHNEIHSRPAGGFNVAIVPGLQVASQIPALFAAASPGSVYRSQDLVFSRAVPVGTEVRVRIKVERVRLLKGGARGAVAMCATTCYLEGPTTVAVRGTASVLVPALPV